MDLKPFLKWAGGKRWLLDRPEFELPKFPGRYIEPFLGGGAVFFRAKPRSAILSDINPRLIETYVAIRDDHQSVVQELALHQGKHCKEYYYSIRPRRFNTPAQRAAQFLYLNRTCWNGLYRENLKGEFNVPIGTKTKILDAEEDLGAISELLKTAEIRCTDFGDTVRQARDGDLLFVDPPYTTAHNFNGFVKYNENVFSWEDQVRLRDDLKLAKARGAIIILTNADHQSIRQLYEDAEQLIEISRASVISGAARGRQKTTECLIRV